VSDPPPPPPPPRAGAGEAPPWSSGTGQAPPRPSGAGAPPPPGAGEAPPAAPPPWFGAAGDGGPTFSRERLVRPTRGRYVAGVCAAIGRATNTDPVLWRVLLVVLGLFGGVGVLIYLIGWLGIQGEGDSVSPIESLLGRGRSTMAPLSVVLLGAATVLTFAFIVRDGFRATLLGGAVLVGVALLIKRNTGSSQSAPGPDPAATFPFGSARFDPSRPAPAPAGPTPAGPAPAGSAAPSSAAPGSASAGSAPAGSAPTAPTAAFAAAGAPAAGTAPPGEPLTAPLPPTPPGYQPPQFTQPSGGYRPPFAPHGPYAGRPPHAQAGPPPRAPKRPKRPRERSKLGRITFFGLVMVLGLLALTDVAGASVPVSAYFAAVLATIALGLIIGAWFGRARGLIALALVATIGLVISSGVERYGGQVANSDYHPQNISQVADRYDFKLGNVTLDLRAVDFTGVQQDITVAMNVGQIKVLLPANVDTTASVAMDGGRAVVFGREYNDGNVNSLNITDQGSDGTGGGTLRLNIELKTGNVEVSR
jgi:phage shock protein PspC (stress-responsive transcriptional regulator)